MDSVVGTLAEAGCLLILIERGAPSCEHICIEIADLCRGTQPGRWAVNETTVLKSVGLVIMADCVLIQSLRSRIPRPRELDPVPPVRSVQ